jgi:hypothetical protein
LSPLGLRHFKQEIGHIFLPLYLFISPMRFSPNS